MSVTAQIIKSIKEIRGRGRPKSVIKLTPAQKQSAYRQRCATRAQELTKSLSFEYTVFLELKAAIDKVENRYPLQAGSPIKPERKAALYALEELRRTLTNKSNVIKNYTQLDIED